MLRPHTFLLTLLALAGSFSAVFAQTAGVTIPAWIDAGDCGSDPKFAATFNGKPAPILAPLGPKSDQVILLVLDFSSDVTFVDAAKQALAAEIGKLPDNIWVGLLNDQDGLRVMVDPGPHRKPVIDAVESLASSGKPGLLDSVTPALTLADSILRKSPVRVSVFYVTDSNIYTYREDYTNPVINGSDPHDLSRVFPDALIQDKISKLEEALNSLEAPLFVVHLNYRGDTLNESYQNGLLRLTEDTGGMGQLCRSVGEIPEAMAAAFARISKVWRLNLDVPPKLRGSGQIRLSLSCGGDEARLSWRARVRPRED